MRKWDPNHFVSWSVCLCLLMTMCLAGCGAAPAGPAKFKISGKVTFGGEPVPAGKIVFVKKDTQARIACVIKDGYYENEEGKGHLGGKYEVQIEGRDGKRTPIDDRGRLLWMGEYNAGEVGLAKGSDTKDFDVPKSDVKLPPPVDPNQSLEDLIEET